MKKLLLIPAHLFYYFGINLMEIGCEEIYTENEIISVFAIGFYCLQFASYLQDLGQLNAPFID